MKTYYEILGILPSASDSEVKRVGRKKLRGLHPDRNPDNPQAEEEFKVINEAYEILTNKEKRAAYDRFLSVEVTDRPLEAARDLWNGLLDDIINNNTK